MDACFGGVNEGGGRMLGCLVANLFAGQLEVTRSRLDDCSNEVSAFEAPLGLVGRGTGLGPV